MIRSLLLVAVVCTAAFVYADEAQNLLPLPDHYNDISPSAFVNLGGKNYFFSPVDETFEDAYNYCNALERKLLSLDDDVKNKLIADYLTFEGLTDEYWTSGLKVVSKWLWTGNGKLFNFLNWSVNEPDYTGSGEVGVTVSSAGTWFDQPGSSSFKYICEEQELICL